LGDLPKRKPAGTADENRLELVGAEPEKKTAPKRPRSKVASG
jgi:hypothetical protein